MEAPGIAIPIIRADYYVHEDEAYEPEAGPGIEALDADRIAVVLDQVVEGAVTLSVRGPDPSDGYGYEFDTTPEAALLLAGRLSVAATEASRSEVPG